MNLVFLPLSEYINLNGVKLDIVSIAAGIALSRHVQVPATPVSSLNMHYVTMVSPTVDAYAAAINESVPINIALTQDTARAFYFVRYSAIHPADDGTVILPGEGGFFERLFNVRNYIDKSLLSDIQNNEAVIIATTNRILSLIPRIKIN